MYLLNVFMLNIIKKLFKDKVFITIFPLIHNIFFPIFIPLDFQIDPDKDYWLTEIFQ